MIIVDIIIASLLLVTIWYCLKLNKKIVELQRGKKDLAILFKYFDNAIKRAEEGIEQLKYNTVRTTEAIDRKINEAKITTDELAFFIEKSTKILRNLEDINAKIMMKEHFVTQDNRRSIQTNEPLNYQPVNRPIYTSPANRPVESASTVSESKKIAIEALLEKISELQKRRKQDVEA